MKRRPARLLMLLALAAALLGGLMTPNVALAVPAAPNIVTLTQPDGTTFLARAWGDEYSNGLETIAGYTILRDARTQFWHYADVDPRTGNLRTTTQRVGKDAPSAAALRARPASTPRSAAVKSTGGPRGPIGVGPVPLLVILAQPSDRAPIGSTEADWVSAVFGATNSVKDYYQEVSHNQFTVTSAAETCGTANNGVTNWLTLSVTHPDTSDFGAATLTTLEDQALLAANGCVNFAAFDTNGDHHLTPDELLVVTIVAGYEASLGGSLRPYVWGHQTNITLSSAVDGITDLNYGMFGEWHATSDDPAGHRATIGVIVHEVGHLLGWPDLYDLTPAGNADSKGIGEWSLMSYGNWLGNPAGATPAHPSAWEKWYQGWITPLQHLGPAGTLTLQRIEDHPIGSAVVLLQNKDGVDWSFNEHSGTGEYFLVENRQQFGYDSQLPGCGLLVWHIDETRTSTNDANADKNHRLVDLVEADGANDLDNNVNQGDAGDPYPGSTNNTAFTPTSNPNSNFYTFGTSNVAITNISAGCADSKTATFSSVYTFVDPDNAGPQDGTAANPFTTVLAGLNAVPAGGAVGVRAGTYVGDYSLLNRPMEIQSLGGLVVLRR